MKYNENFKKEMVKKMLLPGSSTTELSKEIGVSSNTLYNWRNKFAYSDGIKYQNDIPRNWKILDKINAVFAYGKLSENESGKWLRENGLKSDHLKIWEKELILMASSTSDKEEIKKLKLKNTELEKDLLKKDKALAEVSALLILRKKYNALFSVEEEK